MSRALLAAVVRDFGVGGGETRTFAMEDTLTGPAGGWEPEATLGHRRVAAAVTTRVTVTG